MLLYPGATSFSVLNIHNHKIKLRFKKVYLINREIFSLEVVNKEFELLLKIVMGFVARGWRMRTQSECALNDSENYKYTFIV